MLLTYTYCNQLTESGGPVMKPSNDGKLRSGGSQVNPGRMSRDSIDRLAQLPVELLSDDLASSSASLPQVSVACEAMVSSCGDGEGRVSHTACPSQLPRAGCAELVHELSNLITGVLLNAQVLEWKLPPHSHLKRPVHELTRNAQRSSELLKRLSCRCTDAGQETPGTQPRAALAPATARPASALEPTRAATGCGPANGSAGRLSPDLTGACDSRTSGVFPKGDDRSAR